MTARTADATTSTAAAVTWWNCETWGLVPSGGPCREREGTLTCHRVPEPAHEAACRPGRCDELCVHQRIPAGHAGQERER